MKKPIQKQKFVGMEAPAVRIDMLSGETKVIGMMADKVQVMITLPSASDLNDKLLSTVVKHQSKSNIYLISPEPILCELEPDIITTECEKFSLKYGVFMEDNHCAKSLFIIDKDGEIIYRELVVEEGQYFDTEAFDEALTAAIAFKKTGHTHENWMSA